MMTIYSLALTMAATAAVAFYGALRWTFYEPLRRATEEHIVHAAKQQSHFLETVRGVQSIKLFGRQEERRSRWLNLVVDAVNQDLATQKLGLGFRSANGLVFGLERIAIVWLGALLVLDSAFSVGMLFAFMAYKEQFSARVAGLIDKMIELRMLNLQGERLADIVLTPPEEESPSRRADAIDAVARSARALLPLLRHGALRAAQLLLRGGARRVGGHRRALGRRQDHAHQADAGAARAHRRQDPRRRHRHPEARHRPLPQARRHRDAGRPALRRIDRGQHQLLRSLARPGAIERFARLAAVHDDIVAMPMAYNTLIGDMGAALSGGQKQRILLARALYKQPRILFLDEATSALDVQKERAVNDAIRSLNLTRIIIAHRPRRSHRPSA